jgi:hypothetical protein
MGGRPGIFGRHLLSKGGCPRRRGGRLGVPSGRLGRPGGPVGTPGGPVEEPSRHERLLKRRPENRRRPPDATGGEPVKLGGHPVRTGRHLVRTGRHPDRPGGPLGFTRGHPRVSSRRLAERGRPLEVFARPRQWERVRQWRARGARCSLLPSSLARRGWGRSFRTGSQPRIASRSFSVEIRTTRASPGRLARGQSRVAPARFLS